MGSASVVLKIDEINYQNLNDIRAIALICFLLQSLTGYLFSSSEILCLSSSIWDGCSLDTPLATQSPAIAN